MKNNITIQGIKCYAFHGCLKEEARIGGHYSVDVSIDTDFMDAANTDSLQQTIDYCDVAKIVQEEMLIRSKLIEHVGNRIMQRILQDFRSLISVEVKVVKFTPPINANVESVSITIKSN